jgi:hypothetical protein
MVSIIASNTAEGLEPKEKPRLNDEIAAAAQRKCDVSGPSRAQPPRDLPRRSETPRTPRGYADDLEERIGPKLIFSINELAKLADRSPATIFRLLRLGLLPFVTVGGSRCFTRAIVLDFLRQGTRRSEAA